MMIKCKKGIASAAIVIMFASMTAAQSFAADKLSDADISSWVRDSLRVDPRVDVAKITVTSERGIVTLSGDVDNLAAKKYANLEAKKINGVLGVINKITVTPTWRSDADIKYAVNRRILASAAITSEGIMVSSNDGNVLLSGGVDGWGQIQQAGLLASEVLGVKSVKNNLVAVQCSERSDQAIKKDVIAALQRDVYLSSLPIMVAINDGVLTLTGSVGSVFERDRTTQKVRLISNCTGVVNDLKIEGGENRGVRKKMAKPSDDALKRTIKNLLDQDLRVAAADITIRADRGVITLGGTVNSYYQMKTAEQDANNVVGVDFVINNLLVSAVHRSDQQIQDDITFNFGVDYMLAGFQLKSKVKDGVVLLTGEVHGCFEKDHAEELAAGVVGVKRILNKIAIR